MQFEADLEFGVILGDSDTTTNQLALTPKTLALALPFFRAVDQAAAVAQSNAGTGILLDRAIESCAGHDDA